MQLNQSYGQKLRSPLWQKKRLHIFNRDNWTCQNKACNSTHKNLQIHHKDYIPGIEPWNYPDDMLITLCEDCHAKEQGRIELERNLATTLKMKGFLLSDLLAMSSLIDTNKKFTESLLHVLRDFQR